MKQDEFDVHDEEEMNQIHNFDFGRAAMLMSIAEKVATVSPKSTHLLGIAQAELDYMNNQAKDIARSRQKKILEADQRRKEAEQRRLEHEAKQHEAANAPRAIPSAQPGEPMPERHVPIEPDYEDEEGPEPEVSETHAVTRRI